jgi:hypothetical protein
MGYVIFTPIARWMVVDSFSAARVQKASQVMATLGVQVQSHSSPPSSPISSPLSSLPLPFYIILYLYYIYNIYI